MKSLGFLFTTLLVLGLSASCRPEYPPRSMAQLTLRLVDDTGQPVPQAKVAVVGFHVAAEGKTDKSGCFLATLRTVSGEVDLEASKEGYYSINRHTYLFTGETNGQFYPSNPLIELQFHKIEKPVPMVVKHVEEEIPVVDQPVGYDLLKSDWVKPYGHGETPDLIFEAKRSSEGSDDVNGWLRLTFSDPADGLFPVRLFWRNDYELKLAAIAPTNGYRSKWWWAIGKSDEPKGEGWIAETNMDQDANYYLRVRSQTGRNGEMRALYGKIYRGISLELWAYRTNVTVKFDYYLNPDGTRNTEFDTGRNLCPHPGTYGKGH